MYCDIAIYLYIHNIYIYIYIYEISFMIQILNCQKNSISNTMFIGFEITA